MLAYLGDAEDARRHAGAEDAPPRCAGHRARFRGAQRPDGRRVQRPGQQRRPAGAERRAHHRGLSGEARSQGVLRQGQLLLADAARRRSPAWSIRCPSPAASACTSRSTSPARRASARTWNGSTASTTRSTRKRSERFYAAIRRYWPGLPDGALAPGYAGIRPKTAGPGEPAPDFDSAGTAVHGVPGLVHLFGIESPGLTSSLALAGLVLDELR